MIEHLRAIIVEAIRTIYPDIHQPIFSIDDHRPMAGDLATNVSFVIAKEVRKSPLEIGRVIAKTLGQKTNMFAEVKPEKGFINMKLNDQIFKDEIDRIVEAGQGYGRLSIGKGLKVRLEFISANPTGPLHIGNARGGPIGDALANCLQAAGYTVLKEYFHNDVGGQVKKLGESIFNLQKGGQLADQEYKGEYVRELAAKIGSVKDAKSANQRVVGVMFQSIMADAQAMGIKFDKIYNESDLLNSGVTKQAITDLEGRGVVKRQAGAVWLTSASEGLADRESVLVKADGSYTYFANDIAYHHLKFREGYDLIIDVWGANHHGHVERIKAALKALGHDLQKFRVVLYQFVHVKQGQEKVKMSKRAGEFVTAQEVLEAVGRDAFRFFMLTRDPATHLDFDLELAKKRSRENPVYYVQYAVVRAKGIMEKCRLALGVEPVEYQRENDQRYGQAERRLVVQLAWFPELVKEAAHSLKVHLLTQYATDLARLFHDFYEQSPVLEGKRVEQRRLKIVQATSIVLGNTLKLLGVAVPDRM